MNSGEILGVYAGTRSTPLAVIDAARACTREELWQFGLDDVDAAQLLRLAAVWAPSQSSARALVEANHHTFNTLALIERFAARVPKARRWELRRTLAACPARIDELKKRGTSAVDELVGPKPDPPAKATCRRISGTAMCRITMTVPQAVGRGVVDALDTPAKVEAAVSRMAGGEDGGAAVVLNVVIGYRQLGALQSVDDNGDMVFACTNGSVITLRQMVQQSLSTFLNVLVLDPDGEPLELFRAQRFPNDKIRTVTKLMDPVCVAPGCSTGADRCQWNHNKEWSEGGTTGVSNGSSLCARHNGQRKRVVRVGGENHVVQRWGPPRRNAHPAAGLGVRGILADAWAD